MNKVKNPREYWLCRHAQKNTENTLVWVKIKAFHISAEFIAIL
jgi:hypothetical protein